MARDGNGNYTLPAGNPVVADTLIESQWANDTMSDLANEMTDSLSRSGKGGLTAPLGVVDSQGSVPGLSFNSEPTSGFQRDASNVLSIRVTTTEVIKIYKDQVQFLHNGMLQVPVYDDDGNGKVMRGVANTTRCWFYNATVPPGWTTYYPDQDIRMLTIDGFQGNPGTTGGTENPYSFSAYTSGTASVVVNTGNQTTDGHTLDVNEIPAHSHTGSFNSNGTQGTGGTGVAGTSGPNTGSTGGGQAHSHGWSYVGFANGTSEGNSDNVELTYAEGVMGTLDS